VSADVTSGPHYTKGVLETRAGIAVGFASLITLSTGGVVGARGPGCSPCWRDRGRWLVVPDQTQAAFTGRDLLGFCACGGSCIGSFNAPIAVGRFFAARDRVAATLPCMRSPRIVSPLRRGR